MLCHKIERRSWPYPLIIKVHRPPCVGQPVSPRDENALDDDRRRVLQILEDILYQVPLG